MTLSSIEIHGAKHTRQSFLDPLFEPLIKNSYNAGYTLADMLEQVGGAVEKLQRFGKGKKETTISRSSNNRIANMDLLF